MGGIQVYSEDVLKLAANSLKQGHLVAFPTETVYGLGADAQNLTAVKRIYLVKGRPVSNPLIVHISSDTLLEEWARNIPIYARKLAKEFWPGPITLVFDRTDIAKDFVTGNQQSVALRVPSHPIALKILEKFESLGTSGIAAPSANRYGFLSPTNADSVSNFLGEYLSPLDLIIDGGPSSEGIESTIVSCLTDIPIIMRPGPITKSMIEKVTGRKAKDSLNQKVRVPGQNIQHYAPRANLFLSGTPSFGDGLLALDEISTPQGVIRIGSPTSSYEFAKILYSSLYIADQLKIKNVYVIPPEGDEISIAILDRLNRAAKNLA
jgi:L-threonylcarbamoyladenylate synthase